MASKKKYIIAVIAVIIVIAAIIGYREYNRAPEDPADMHVDVSLNAHQLAAAFAENEIAANEKYAGHNLSVSGKVISISNEGDTIMNATLEGNDALHNVSCSFDKRHFKELQNLHGGDSVKVIGYCTGFLLDVVMNRCALKTK